MGGSRRRLALRDVPSPGASAGAGEGRRPRDRPPWYPHGCAELRQPTPCPHLDMCPDGRGCPLLVPIRPALSVTECILPRQH